VSFAGLTYLTIFLAEFVFALPLPHLSSRASPVSAAIIVDSGTAEHRLASPSRPTAQAQQEREAPLPRFPIMGAILICGIPFLTAMYISSTRYSDYRHRAGDIIAGSILGIASAWLGWRWYGAWTMCAQAEGRVYGFVHRGASAKRTDVDQKQGIREERVMAV
jgi:hypothetical protein